MHQTAERSTKPEHVGLVIHGAARYDVMVWLFTLGGERRLRAKMLALAQLRPGEDVLDIGGARSRSSPSGPSAKRASFTLSTPRRR